MHRQWNRHLLFYALLLSCFLAGCADVSPASSRITALNLIYELSENGAKQRFPEEYRSLKADYVAGVERLQSDDPAGAERFFQRAAAKGERLYLSRAKPAAADSAANEVAPDVPPFAASPAGVPLASSVRQPEPSQPQPAVAAEGAEQTSGPGGGVDNGASPARSPAVDSDSSAANSAEQASSEPFAVFGSMTGGELRYTVKKGDSFRKLSARFRVSPQYLAKINGLASDRQLRRGQILKVVDRHIVPKNLEDGLLINIADCTLYHFKDGKLSESLAVTVGRPKSKDRKPWQTPLGSFTVTAKVKDPTWRVPPSIQKEMDKDGLDVVEEVPPGPDNPLGKYAIRTSLPGILIHSTNEPSSIYGYGSHGCIRVDPDKIEGLFDDIKVNTAGEIIYRPVKLAVDTDGKVYLEVHRDVYEKMKSLDQEVRDLIKKQNVDALIDWQKVKRVVKEKSGVAEDISI